MSYLYPSYGPYVLDVQYSTFHQVKFEETDITQYSLHYAG